MKKTINGKEFVVVTKTPKRFHRIPRLDAKAQLQERQREEKDLQLLAKGTTPQGRELLRKLIWGCQARLREGKTIEEAAAEIEPLVRKFSMLREEWSLLLSRISRFEFKLFADCSSTLFALFLASIAENKIQPPQPQTMAASNKLQDAKAARKSTLQ